MTTDFDEDGAVSDYKDDQWQDVHEQHSKRSVTDFVRSCRKRIERNTLLVPRELRVGLDMKYKHLKNSKQKTNLDSVPTTLFTETFHAFVVAFAQCARNNKAGESSIYTEVS